MCTKFLGEKLNGGLLSGGASLAAQDGQKSACNVGDLGVTPGLGRSPAGGNGNPLQNSCLENPMDRGVRQTMVHGVRHMVHGVRHD